MKKLVELVHIKEKQTWLSYLTDMFKKKNEHLLLEAQNIITDEKSMHRNRRKTRNQKAKRIYIPNRRINIK